MKKPVKQASTKAIEIRDESDKDGIRVVIELKKHENPEVALNILYKHTQLQDVFNINMVALDNGQPKTLNLKQVLNAFVLHRKEVVTRRSEFELKKSKERCHLLEGLGISLNNIDEVIAIIRGSKNADEARERIEKEYPKMEFDWICTMHSMGTQQLKIDTSTQLLQGKNWNPFKNKYGHNDMHFETIQKENGYNEY